MKYKLILSDFDGTLLRDDQTISSANAEAIKDYVKRGGNFVICTGRMVKSIIPWLEYIGIDKLPRPVYGFQGGVAVDGKGNYVSKKTIPWQTAYKIIKIAEDNGIYVHTYEVENVLIEKANEISSNYCKLCKITQKEVGKLSEFVKANQFDCIKIMFVVEEYDMQKWAKTFRDMNIEGVSFYSSHVNFLEAAPANGGKGNALDEIASFYGLTRDEIIAIGDQENDISMIERAGLGCAVENALDIVKAKSDFITLSNNDDGVKYVIDKFTRE